VIPDAGAAPHPGILYVHWLGEEKSDRTEFLDEAVELAKKGAISLLVDTPWSAPHWFETRTCQTDYESSLEQVRDLRRALDVLVAQPGVDPARIGYVGHDFGAMYGVLMGAADPRPKAFVLMAGTTHFADWFLLGAAPKDKGTYVRQMAELDPLRFIGEVAPRAILFQFAKEDPYVARATARAFFNAANEPKELHFYETTHRMDDAGATAERVRWLSRALSLPEGP
jgi:dienelactone hydrolase